MSQEEISDQLRMFEETGLWIRAEMAKLERALPERASQREARHLIELCARNAANHLATKRFLRTHQIL